MKSIDLQKIVTRALSQIFSILSKQSVSVTPRPSLTRLHTLLYSQPLYWHKVNTARTLIKCYSTVCMSWHAHIGRSNTYWRQCKNRFKKNFLKHSMPEPTETAGRLQCQMYEPHYVTLWHCFVAICAPPHLLPTPTHTHFHASKPWMNQC